jgi:aspartokinase
MLAEAAGRAGGRCTVMRRESGLATISVVGAGFLQSPETIGKACAALRTTPVLVDTRNTQIDVCLPEADLAKTLESLHAALIEDAGK